MQLRVRISRFLIILPMMALFVGSAHGFRTNNRYFPFLEKSHYLVAKGMGQLCVEGVVTTASTAFRRTGGNTGIPELDGLYNLKDVIRAQSLYAKELGKPFTNPLAIINPEYVDKDLIYRIDGKIKSAGVNFAYEQYLGQPYVALGGSLTALYVHTLNRYTFKADGSNDVFKNLTFSEYDQLDSIRRSIQDSLGICGHIWSYTGMADSEVHLTVRYHKPYIWSMRGVDFISRFGAIIPTGKLRDINFPSSVSFGGDHHWGLFADALCELELKLNWRLGIMGSALAQLGRDRLVRLPVFDEIPLFSPLIRRVKIHPGLSFQVAPYFTLENVIEGVNVQFKYTYLRHHANHVRDCDINAPVKSYLTRSASTEDMISEAELAAVRIFRHFHSSWRAHYATLQLTYDAKAVLNNWLFDPHLYLVYDYPLGGRGVCKTHQLSIGAAFHF